MPIAARTCCVFVVAQFVSSLHTASTFKIGYATDALGPGGGSLAALPDRSIIAILLRGRAFRKGGRGHRKACFEDKIPDQLRITQSMMDKVVLPLERASHTVHIYLFESSGCHLLGHVADLLEKGKHRVQQTSSFVGKNQGTSMSATLQQFSSHVDPATYMAIIATRFDIAFKAYIYEWPTVNFGALNFFSRCQKAGSAVNFGTGMHDIIWCPTCVKPEFCVNDIMHVIPGTYFETFRDVVGHGMCFTKGGYWTGHYCYNQTVRKFGVENVGFVTDWVPENSVRESNKWVDFL